MINMDDEIEDILRDCVEQIQFGERWVADTGCVERIQTLITEAVDKRTREVFEDFEENGHIAPSTADPHTNLICWVEPWFKNFKQKYLPVKEGLE
jgi:hypothetical protein